MWESNPHIHAGKHTSREVGVFGNLACVGTPSRSKLPKTPFSVNCDDVPTLKNTIEPNLALPKASTR